MDQDGRFEAMGPFADRADTRLILSKCLQKPTQVHFVTDIELRHAKFDILSEQRQCLCLFTEVFPYSCQDEISWRAPPIRLCRLLVNHTIELDEGVCLRQVKPVALVVTLLDPLVSLVDMSALV